LPATKINSYAFDVQEVFNFMKIKLVQPKKPVKAGPAVISSVKYYNFGNFLRHQIYLAESMDFKN
jgi:hypothetical protein